MYKAVIFDLDGTLLNTLTDLADAVNFALRSFSFPERSLDEVRSFIGNGVIKLMERATPDSTDSQTQTACFEEFRKYYLEHMSDNTCPYDGIIPMLKSIKEMNIKTAVVSNKLHSAVEELCRDIFPDMIDLALGVSCEEERKPAPLNVFRAMDFLCCNKEDTLYVGDSEVDVQTAHNAGIKCLGITWGYRDKNELIGSGCDFTADTAQEVIAKLINQ